MRRTARAREQSLSRCAVPRAGRAAEESFAVEATIEGNRTLPESVLATCWSSLANATFADAARALDVLEDEIARASDAIERFYLDAGFAAVRQAEPKMELSPDRRRLRVTFVIDEGERHRVGRVQVRGPMSWDTMSIPGVSEGDWFCRRRLEAGLAALRRAWERSTGKRMGVAVEVMADPVEARLDLCVVGEPTRSQMVS